MRSFPLALSTLSLLASAAAFADVGPTPIYGQYAPQGADAYSVCAQLTFDSDKNTCMQAIAGKYISPNVVQVCSQQVFASDAIACLRQVAGHTYDAEAVRICQGLTFSSDQNKCLAAIPDKAFDPNALNVCRSMTFASETIQCMQNAGYEGGYQPYPGPTYRPQNPGDVIGDILLDTLDRILEKTLNDYATPGPIGSMCRVVNSNGRLLGRVAPYNLETAAERFARDQKTCVVTNVKNQTRSRTVIGAYGEVLGRDLSEKEASRLKHMYGYSNCRVMTCEL